MSMRNQGLTRPVERQLEATEVIWVYLLNEILGSPFHTRC